MFSISEFLRVNRTYMIWAAFAALLYVFRSLFGLLFITYIMCFIASSISHSLRRMLHLNRRVIIVGIFAALLVLVAAFIRFIPPRLFSEAMSFTEQLPSSLHTVNAWIDAKLGDNELIAPMIEQARHVLTPELAAMKGWGIARGILEGGLHYVSWLFIAMLFSFLIMLDLPRLAQSARNLRFTRLSGALHEVSKSVALFARVVGENFRAQLIVSAVNTTLTAIGLCVLGVKAVVLLCTIVFICGLIPVLGVFISSVPVVLMAVNSGGMELGLWAVLLIVAIHLLEAYVLNPRIVSSVMHINPVVTIIILYIAHTIMGMWGMLLGVPIAVYIYHKISMKDGGKPAHKKAVPAPAGEAFPGRALPGRRTAAFRVRRRRPCGPGRSRG
ncbi:MAG: AI-2E family transporter [Desulfovibrio sp.]